VTDVASTAPTRPETIKAVPVRHPGRWVAVAVIAILVVMFMHMIVTNDAFGWSFMYHNMFRAPVLEGVRTTVVATVVSMLFGVAIGMVVAVMRLSPNPILSSVSWVYTWFFRAVPRLVLLTLCGNLGILYKQITLGLPFVKPFGNAIGLHGDAAWAAWYHINANTFLAGLTAGIIGLSLSEGAYMAEIVRAGILSIESGQAEAAQALGMGRTLTMRRIVLPQAMRVIVPPTGNETIAMLKDTSLLIAVPVTNELFFQLSGIGSRTFNVFPMLVAACLWYLALSSVLLVAQYYVERYFSRGVAGRAKERTLEATVPGGGPPQGAV
jgi:polar amino acid transport system permease protein